MEHVVRLTNYIFGGDCLGRLPDGRAVFVPFTIPGELVRIQLVEEKRSYCRAAVLEIIEPSPQRINPLCSHFGECGGCQYQHIPYTEQLALKTSILKDQLERVGELKEVCVLPCVAAPEPFHYRNYVQFHQTPTGQLGYFKANPHEVFPVRECFLLEKALGELWPLLSFDESQDFERVSLRKGAGDDIQIILEGAEPTAPELLVEDLPVSVVYRFDEQATVLAGSEFTTHEINGNVFLVSSGSFFQVNSMVAARMVEKLLASLRLNAISNVLDVYCGVGLFSKFIAPVVDRVVGVESSPDACGDFAVNLDEFENVELYQAQAEQVLPLLKYKPEAVILDPPRSGIGRRAMDGLLQLSPATVAYVSCDPATLARDARKLIDGGYSLMEVTPFDMFPQTSHVESVSLWIKD